MKVWNRQGKILYSDEPRLIGDSYGLAADERRSLDVGIIEAEVSDLAEAEIATSGRTASSSRSTCRSDRLRERRCCSRPTTTIRSSPRNGNRLFRSFAPISLGALLMLELVQIPIAWSLARRLRMRMRERELLLHRALEASDVERRQIASDLHDGAVQDLAGVAYALSATARRDGAAGSSPDTKVIEDAAESIRDSIRSLRSLIVDIYPPDFDEVSFDSAMTDLLTRGSDRGLSVDLDIQLDDPLPDSAAAAAVSERAGRAAEHPRPCASLRRLAPGDPA